jgi:hypothetical protein
MPSIWLSGGFGSLARSFCILHSAFCLRLWVALPGLSSSCILPSAFSRVWLWGGLAASAADDRKSGQPANPKRGGTVVAWRGSVRCASQVLLFDHLSALFFNVNRGSELPVWDGEHSRELPLNLQLQAFYNVERPDDCASWQLRFQMLFLFPESTRSTRLG